MTIIKEKRLELLGILIVTVSLLTLLSFFGHDPNEDPGISPNVKVENPMGILGVWISYLFIKLGFGYSSFILPILSGVWGVWFFMHKDFKFLGKTSVYLLGSTLLISISLGFIQIVYFGLDNLSFAYSGMAGGVIAILFYDFLGAYGTFILIAMFWLVLTRSYFNLSFYKPLKKIYSSIEKRRAQRQLISDDIKAEKEKKEHTQNLLNKIEGQRKADPLTDQPLQDSVSEFAQPKEFKIDNDIDSAETKKNKIEIDSGINDESKIDESLPGDNDGIGKIEVEEMIEEEEIDLDTVEDRIAAKKEFLLPSPELLTNPVSIQSGISKDELVDRANFLQQSLETFGVIGKVVNVSPGPVITLFEVEPAEGVRVNKFVALSDDLARVMEASRVRVIAPIPGKSSVGIEIPNRNPDMVYFKSVINSEKFAKSESKLTLAIGKSTNGEIATLDLAQMPHLLIAGTTGSGKSVCMNTILASILYQASPDEVKFVIVDPKKVEMAVYKDLSKYHLLKIEDIDEPIITTPENAVIALRAVEKEMGKRYDILADAGVRNIAEYNKKQPADSIMPFIIVLIDELADLMMLNAKEVEAPIARLTQLARAVGIHLVVATQRPSVDVITGVIKANFPSRIAFQVATKIDSRTIIDSPGAEKLIGKGDMLYLGYGSSEPSRLHNAFLSLDEIQSLMTHINKQPEADDLVLESPIEVAGAGGLVTENGTGGFDALFDDAVKLVVMHQQGSISLIQRRLKVGYSRAARLIDEMEQAGIVGAFTGSKAREVLVDESYLDSID